MCDQHVFCLQLMTRALSSLSIGSIGSIGEAMELAFEQPMAEIGAPHPVHTTFAAITTVLRYVGFCLQSIETVPHSLANLPALSARSARHAHTHVPATHARPPACTHACPPARLPTRPHMRMHGSEAEITEVTERRGSGSDGGRRRSGSWSSVWSGVSGGSALCAR